MVDSGWLVQYHKYSEVQQTALLLEERLFLGTCVNTKSVDLTNGLIMIFIFFPPESPCSRKC